MPELRKDLFGGNGFSGSATNLTNCSSRPPSHQLAPTEHQARRRLNKALDFVGKFVATPRIHARAVGLVVGSWSIARSWRSGRRLATRNEWTGISEAEGGCVLTSRFNMVGRKPAFSVRLIRGVVSSASHVRRTRWAVGPAWSPCLWSAPCARQTFVAP